MRSCDINLMGHVADRKFHSTETALFKVQNDVFQSLDQTNVTILVLLDLSAAFDTIDHQPSSPRTSLWGKPLTWMASYFNDHRLLDSLVVECWLRVLEVPGSIPSQGPRHTKDVIKMVPVVPLFGTEHSKGKILALSEESR